MSFLLACLAYDAKCGCYIEFFVGSYLNTPCFSLWSFIFAAEEMLMRTCCLDVADAHFATDSCVVMLLMQNETGKDTNVKLQKIM
jgi:hypothetical protein